MARPAAAPSYKPHRLAADMRTFAIMTLALVAPIAAQSSAQTAACSGTMALVLGSSPLTISDGPSDYSPRMNCEWIVTSPPGTRIVLTFSSFQTESGYDLVAMHDSTGGGNAGLRVGLSGTSLPQPLVSVAAGLRTP